MVERTWIRAEGQLQCDYHALVDVTRPDVTVSNLEAVPPHLLPGETVRYLMPSCLCPSDLFQFFVTAEFGSLTGEAKVDAMRNWINKTIAYTPGASDPQITALDTFVQRRDVCRDFAHVLVTFARV